MLDPTSGSRALLFSVLLHGSALLSPLDSELDTRGQGLYKAKGGQPLSQLLPLPLLSPPSLPLSSEDFNKCISACGPSWGFIRMNCLSRPTVLPRNDNLQSTHIY